MLVSIPFLFGALTVAEEEEEYFYGKAACFCST